MKATFYSCLAAGLLLAASFAAAQPRERAPYGYAPTEPDKPIVTTGANSCNCEVADASGSACMIYLRTNAGDWITQNAPQTRLHSSNEGRRYYDTPFALAASACAGRQVKSSTVKVHWLDRKNAILEWK